MTATSSAKQPCNHGRRRRKKEGVWSLLELVLGLMPMQWVELVEGLRRGTILLRHQFVSVMKASSEPAQLVAQQVGEISLTLIALGLFSESETPLALPFEIS